MLSTFKNSAGQWAPLDYKFVIKILLIEVLWLKKTHHFYHFPSADPCLASFFRADIFIPNNWPFHNLGIPTHC